MSAADELLDRLAEIGATIRPAGDRLIVRAGAQPVPPELVRSLRETKRDILARLSPTNTATRLATTATDLVGAHEWRDHYAARLVHWFSGGRHWHQSEAVAYGEMILRWHGRHGAYPDPSRCAGCKDELPDEEMLALCDGARVHLDGTHGVNCLIAYGRNWRGAAVAELRALGLSPPDGFELL
jgi:hypothetical protein